MEEPIKTFLSTIRGEKGSSVILEETATYLSSRITRPIVSTTIPSASMASTLKVDCQFDSR